MCGDSRLGLPLAGVWPFLVFNFLRGRGVASSFCFLLYHPVSSH